MNILHFSTKQQKQKKNIYLYQISRKRGYFKGSVCYSKCPVSGKMAYANSAGPSLFAVSVF